MEESGGRRYLAPDGSLLGVQKGEGEDEITRFDLTINFYEELKRRFASASRKSR